MRTRRDRKHALAPFGIALLSALPLWFAGTVSWWAALGGLGLAAAATLLYWRRVRRAERLQLDAAASALERVARGERPEGLRGLAPLGPLQPLLELLDEALPPLAKRMARLEREREELRTLLGSMEEGVVAIDRDARVLLLNDAACRLLGVPFGAGSGLRLWEVSRVEGLREALLAAVQDGRRRRLTIELEATRRPLVLAVEVAALLGREAAGRAPRGAVAVLRDVSEARRLETLRRELIANVTHEFKTPLAAIRALVETLLEDETTSDRARVEGVLARVLEQTERLEGLVADVLSLARLEDVRGAAERTVLDFAELVERSAAQLEPAIVRAGLRLELDVPDDPAPVLGDRKALRRLVDNLIENARNYSEPGGRIALRLRLEPSACVLEVEDEGVGIEPEHQGRVFERFFRVDPSRNRGPGGGSGLGLAIVEQVAKRHGGTVSLRSSPGQGSVFTVRLPRASERA